MPRACLSSFLIIVALPLLLRLVTAVAENDDMTPVVSEAVPATKGLGRADDGGEDQKLPSPSSKEEESTETCSSNSDGNDGKGDNIDSCSGSSTDGKKVWKQTRHTLSHFEVAGVNLASYGITDSEKGVNDAPPFELFEDFDIGLDVVGNETWRQMMVSYKYPLEHPGLVFFKDKVALKRWLPKVGYPIPKPLLLKYGSELTETQNIEDEKRVLRQFLANHKDYVAKPSHKFRSLGVWVVAHDFQTNTTSTSREAADPLRHDDTYDVNEVADSLAENMHDGHSPLASNIEKMVKPGVSIEERFVGFEFLNQPALEFKVQLIWGRVHHANWRLGGWYSQWWPGVVNRNGTMVEGSGFKELPSWVDWDRVVQMAEELGANKDICRVDLFVGVPASSPALRQDATEEQRLAAVEYVVNEINPTSAEPLPDEILEESARLWIAGYKIGNYKVVPNTEVPVEFRGLLPKKGTKLDEEGEQR